MSEYACPTCGSTNPQPRYDEDFDCWTCPECKPKTADGDDDVSSLNHWPSCSQYKPEKVRHCCGTNGFDPMNGDTCDACEKENEPSIADRVDILEGMVSKLMMMHAHKAPPSLYPKTYGGKL